MNRCTEELVELRTKSLIKQLLKIEKAAIEDVHFETVRGEQILIVDVRPYGRQVGRCPVCGRHCSGYDSGNKRRRWRSLDLGSTRVYLEAFAPRVKCPEHGVIVARVPWAQHDSDYTRDFEMAVAWMTLHATATDVSEFFRIEWHSVGSIARRVQKTLEAAQPNRFDDLSEIGIDETSYKKGHKYMTVVVNHKTGALIWAAKGHGKEVLTTFFKELSEEQRAKIKLVSADGARWIADCVKEYCPKAKRCIDPFHVVAWANDALDEVRKSAVRTAKQQAADGKQAERSKKKKILRFKSMPC
jgi:transposase